ncbi:hypothetical protein ZIOFF_034548 [Zingiber officinale]|uniref:RRM domain-containing protein n=1 Tax=Zingiber officinale TaxID=94328 RepID=A0A8J5GL84_ZINOF|nr:hypothetical protein ZIOFF_034548 [Zingiber officinale]
MSRVYVGNLDSRTTEKDLEDEFRTFGVLRRYTTVEMDIVFCLIIMWILFPMRMSLKCIGWVVILSYWVQNVMLYSKNYCLNLCSVWVARRPPGYGFVEFDDRRDALDAIHDLDGKICLFNLMNFRDEIGYFGDGSPLLTEAEGVEALVLPAIAVALAMAVGVKIEVHEGEDLLVVAAILLKVGHQHIVVEILLMLIEVAAQERENLLVAAIRLGVDLLLIGVKLLLISPGPEKNYSPSLPNHPEQSPYANGSNNEALDPSIGWSTLLSLLAYGEVNLTKVLWHLKNGTRLCARGHDESLADA